MSEQSPENPFALMLDPAGVRAQVERSDQLTRLARHDCRPLERSVIRSATAEMAAFDSRIDRKTVYVPPVHDKPSAVPFARSHHDPGQREWPMRGSGGGEGAGRLETLKQALRKNMRRDRIE